MTELARRQGNQLSPADHETLKIRAWHLYAMKRMSKVAIGKELGISHTTVGRLVNEAIEELRPDMSEELAKDIAILDEELDVAHARYMYTKKHYDQLVVDRIIERRSKLLGYAAPERIEAAVVHITPQDLEIQQLLAERKAQNTSIKRELRESMVDLDV